MKNATMEWMMEMMRKGYKYLEAFFEREYAAIGITTNGTRIHTFKDEKYFELFVNFDGQTIVATEPRATPQALNKM